MKNVKEMMLLYAVTDRTWLKDETLYQQVEKALKGGVTCIQLREKRQDESEFLKEAHEIHELCQTYSVPFIINDNVNIAIACQADGVHIGQDDMSCQKARQLIGDDMILGVSCQTVEQAIQAQKDGADYLGVGAVFPTDTKSDAIEVNHQTLKDICQSVDIPVVAIGGINKQNILELKGTDVDGVALVSAIFAANDIQSECQELKQLSMEMIQYD
ncbi:MAG: thiamine phosphate synthase [Coprobacillus sp.]